MTRRFFTPVFIAWLLFVPATRIHAQDTALPAPHLTASVTGTTVHLVWNPVIGATGYLLFYSPFPDAQEVSQVNLGQATSFTADLGKGAAFFVAVQALSDAGPSDFSNVETIVVSPEPATFAGTFSGTYAGDDIGTWSILVDEAGRALGSFYSYSRQDGWSLAGTVDEKGSFTLSSQSTAMPFLVEGTVTEEGSMEGTWTVPGVAGSRGTFAGSRR